MIRKYTIVIAALVLLLVSDTRGASYIIEVEDDEFSPAVLNVQVGDTLIWMWDEGIHTTTSTLIPAGAMPWDVSMTQSSVIFIYIPTVPGSYDYQCTIHASMGMLGHFTVFGTTSISDFQRSDIIVNSTAIKNEIFVTFNEQFTDFEIQLMSLTGGVVKTFRPSSSSGLQSIPVHELRSGIYIMNVRNSGIVHSYKLVKE